MLVTANNAKQFLSRFAPDLKIRLSTRCTIVQHPIYMGLPVVTARKLSNGDSVVDLGVLDQSGRIYDLPIDLYQQYTA